LIVGENNLTQSHEDTKNSKKRLGGLVALCELFMVIGAAGMVPVGKITEITQVKKDRK